MDTVSQVLKYQVKYSRCKYYFSKFDMGDTHD